jgi:hypothetical protein
MTYTTCMNNEDPGERGSRKGKKIERKNHTFLRLLAKIKCSICSYQFKGDWTKMTLA